MRREWFSFNVPIKDNDETGDIGMYDKSQRNKGDS